MWTVIGGALPLGLQLTSAGTISGTPTATGMATFTARATDSAGGFAAGVFTITIDPTPLEVISTALPNAIASCLGSPARQRIRRFCALHLCDHARRAAFTADLQQRADQQWRPRSDRVVEFHGHGDGCRRQHGERSVHAGSRANRAGSGSLPGVGIVLHRHRPGGFLPAAANVAVGSSVAASLAFNVLANPAAPWLDFTQSGNAPGRS